MPGLAFDHLNLRWNPFGDLPLSERPALALVDIEPLVAALAGPFCAVEFLGDKGRGKTTQLLSLHRRFSAAPYRHIDEDERVRSLPQAPLLFIDESQRLPQKLWRRLAKRGVTLALASHVSHASWLRKQGYAVLSRTVGLQDPQEIAQVFARRIEAARRNPGALPQVSAAGVAVLISRWGDDLRSMEGVLYRCVQALPAPRSIEAEHIVSAMRSDRSGHGQV